MAGSRVICIRSLEPTYPRFDLVMIATTPPCPQGWRSKGHLRRRGSFVIVDTCAVLQGEEGRAEY